MEIHSYKRVKKNDNTSVGHQTSLTQIRLSKRVAISRQHGSSNEIQLLQPKGKQINVKHDSQSHPVAQTIRSTSRLGLTTRLKETRCKVDRTTRQNGQGYDRREWTSAKWESEQSEGGSEVREWVRFLSFLYPWYQIVTVHRMNGSRYLDPIERLRVGYKPA
jgi:hypothetical protein